MIRDLIGRCGAYCGTCDWREETHCPGCQSCQGSLFWGECAIARCSIGREIEHCGFCPDLPCGLLQEAFTHPEHGDHGERLANLKAWASGEQTFIVLGTFPARRDQ